MMVIFTTFMALMGAFFFVLIKRYKTILEKRQQEALSNLILGQDNERERLSRDLHDQVGPQLNAIAVFASMVRTDEPSVKESLEEIKDELWKTVSEVRNISHDLMSTSLRKYGLTEAVRKLIARSNYPGLSIDLQSNTDASELSDVQIAHLYNILRELVYNTIKHAGASEVKITFDLDSDKQSFSMSYSDNGRGKADFDPKDAGIGLANIRTRVRLMNGDIQIDMQKGFQCKINIHYIDGTHTG